MLAGGTTVGQPIARRPSITLRRTEVKMSKLAGAVFAIVVGGIGGACFYFLGLPLPWMMGSMILCIAAALSRLPISSPRIIRPPFAVILGVTLGSTFNYEVITAAAHWGSVFVAMIIFTVISTTLSYVYLRRIGKYDAPTAYYASVPGGIYDLTALGGEAGGDERRIALAQSTRIVLLVLFVPLLFRSIYGLSGGAVAPLSILSENWLVDVGLLVAAGVLGWPLARLIRLPNPPLMGPLLLSAAIHVGGLTQAAPPAVLVAAAQIVIGASIGGQFIGTAPGLVLSSMRHALVLFAPVMIVCALIAWPTAALSSVDLPIVILALAPGGMSEMSLIALALHAEVAVVSANQMLRMLCAHLFASTIFRRLVPRAANNP
ncbi:MAG: hypothetical protein ABS76_12350 [Pelagibacterium sp. SCN 64-44]|nr:MAG: hypothetical protein ABS76_12350 [Pelagibacterium sp. SCN 64-44]